MKLKFSILVFLFFCISTIFAKEFAALVQSDLNVKHTPVSNYSYSSLASQQEEWPMAQKFWFHSSYGLGFTTAQAKDFNGSDYRFSGLSFISELELGIYLKHNNLLFADFFGQRLISPSVKYGDEKISFSGLGDVSINWSGFGVGLGHYFEPKKYLIKGSIGSGYLSIREDDYIIGKTNLGIYGTVSVGKEWLISPYMTLGLTLHGHFGSMNDKEDAGFAPKWKASGFGATFTLTWVPRGLKL